MNSRGSKDVATFKISGKPIPRQLLKCLMIALGDSILRAHPDDKVNLDVLVDRENGF